jgi:hypothetical protein
MHLVSPYSSEADNKHLSPVWQLEWTDHDRKNTGDSEEEIEILMSISADGRVTQWMIRKGFESNGINTFFLFFLTLKINKLSCLFVQDYLKLKRVIDNNRTNKKTDEKADENKKNKSDGLISRHAGGLCFDILEQDKTM